MHPLPSPVQIALGTFCGCCGAAPKKCLVEFAFETLEQGKRGIALVVQGARSR